MAPTLLYIGKGSLMRHIPFSVLVLGFAFLAPAVTCADDHGKPEIEALLTEQIRALKAEKREQVYAELRDALEPFDIAIFGGQSTRMQGTAGGKMLSGKPALTSGIQISDDIFACPASLKDDLERIQQGIETAMEQTASIGKFHYSVDKLSVSETEEALENDPRKDDPEYREAKLREIYEKHLSESLADKAADAETMKEHVAASREIFKFEREEAALRRNKCVLLRVGYEKKLKYSLDPEEMAVEEHHELEYEISVAVNDVFGDAFHAKKTNKSWSLNACKDFIKSNYKGAQMGGRYVHLLLNALNSPAECIAELKSTGLMNQPAATRGADPTPAAAPAAPPGK